MKKTHYSDEFKRTVVREVLDGVLCKDEARRKYGIKGKSAVINWIRRFDTSKAATMKKTKPASLSGRSREELEAENRRLREELEMEQLRSRSLNIMIDIAEEYFKIPIRKKSGAKQSGN